jgi:hypothetical protein
VDVQLGARRVARARGPRGRRSPRRSRRAGGRANTRFEVTGSEPLDPGVAVDIEVASDGFNRYSRFVFEHHGPTLRSMVIMAQAAFGSIRQLRPYAAPHLSGGVGAIGRLSRARLRVVVIHLVDK